MIAITLFLMITAIKLFLNNNSGFFLHLIVIPNIYNHYAAHRCLFLY